MIKKVSDINIDSIIRYLRISDDLVDDEKKDLETLFNVSKSFITSYTGIKDLDEHQDFVIVVYVLIQDMYDNRTLYIDKNNVNKVIFSILDMHSGNLL